jgi:hypothetical protein
VHRPGHGCARPQTLGRSRELYAEVVRRWQAAGHLDPTADPIHIGAVLMGLVHAFAIQRLLLPGTDRDQYVASVRALLGQPAPRPLPPNHPDTPSL